MKDLSQLIKEGERELFGMAIDALNDNGWPNVVTGYVLQYPDVVSFHRQSTRSLLTGIIEGMRGRMGDLTKHPTTMSAKQAIYYAEDYGINKALQSVIDDLSELLKEIK